MTAKLQIYKCELCGNVVEMVHAGEGSLVCCGEEMKLYEENTVDAAKEKHVPVVETAGDGTKVTVGSVAHPMAEDHYIEWIQVNAGDRSCRQFLKPGEAPEASFCMGADGATARGYCNLHGLWKS